MERDSLGARVLESKHTGRWRYACMKLHEFFHENTSPGRKSAAYKTGREAQAIEHTGRYDRNYLMYAMLEIKLSMDGHGIGQTPFSVIELHDRVCGGGADNQFYNTGAGPQGWRVAFDPYNPPPQTRSCSSMTLNGV